MDGTPRFRINLLGDPSVRKDGERIALGLPLLRLAIEHPKMLRREDLLSSLYSDSELDSARNRLRVSLTRLRRAVPLIEHDDRIGLDPQALVVDLAELRQALLETRHEPAVDIEADALRALLPQLATVLFPQATSTWELEAQAAWSRTACLALERLGDLAEHLADDTTAAAAAEASLKHFPYDAAAWNRYLRAMTRMGRATEADKKLTSTRKRARAEGWSLPEDLENWTPKGDERSSLGPELTPGESLALERYFRRALVSEPRIAVEMLGSTSFRPEVLRAPREVLPLLREALALRVPHCEARERIQVRVITALSSLEEFSEVLREVGGLLAEPIAPARRRIALLAASFAYAMEGELDKAMNAVDEALELAAGPTAEYDMQECRAQRASFLMFAGDLVGAESELRTSLDYLVHHAREGSEPDVLSIRGNLGLCLAHQGRFVEAFEILRPVLDSARALNLPTLIGLFAPVAGWTLSHGAGEMGTLLTDGLRSAFRISSRRAILAASYAGLALHAKGLDPDKSVLLETWAYRTQSGIPLHALEANLYSNVTDQRPEASRPLIEFIRATMRICSRVDEA